MEIENIIDKGVYDHAYNMYAQEVNECDHGYIIILPLTPEGEARREYLMDYHHDDDGKLIHTSIQRYGMSERVMNFNGEDYNVIIVNND